MKRIVISLAFLGLICDAALGQADCTAHVDIGIGNPGNGSTWLLAYRHIQDALNANPVCKEIWVAAGTYTPDLGLNQTALDRNATFQLRDNVAIYGGFEGMESVLRPDNRIPCNPTILSGDLNGDDSPPIACTDDLPDCASYGKLCVDGFCIANGDLGDNSLHIVTGSGADSTAKLDGFIIQGGYANDYVGGCDDNRGMGAGLIVYGTTTSGGSPVVENCTFRDNVASLTGC